MPRSNKAGAGPVVLKLKWCLLNVCMPPISFLGMSSYKVQGGPVFDLVMCRLRGLTFLAHRVVYCNVENFADNRSIK